MEKTISSILEVDDADMDDAGIYVCRTSDLQIVSTRVDVLNGRSPWRMFPITFVLYLVYMGM